MRIIYESSNELYHHGILGMKWGVRRYQNKDGTLTAAGKRKLEKESVKIKKEESILKNRKATVAKFDKLAEKKRKLEDEKESLDSTKKSKKVSPDKVSSKKSLKDISDDDLKKLLDRARMEKDYLETTKRISDLTPQKVSKGRKFIESIKDVAVPALKDAAKTQLTKYLNQQLGKKLGLDEKTTKDSFETLKKETETLELMNRKAKAKNEYENRKRKEKEKKQNK